VSSPRIKFYVGVGILLALLSASVHAQTRLRGTIAAFEGGTLTLQNDEKIVVGDKTEIVFTQPIALADIKPGDFLGVTSMKRGGELIAIEVRRFPKPLNPGHRPFDGRDDQTMTNASVGTVTESAGGRELTMTYEGGAQKIVVPEGASVSTLVPGNRAQLVRGAPVSLTLDSRKIAQRIQVGPPRP
jgi:hypothetical protein